MFIAVINVGQINYYPQSTTGAASSQHDTAEKAKAAIADYITRNKPTFQNGYTAYVIDDSAHKVVSFATVPQPTLDWQDSR